MQKIFKKSIGFLILSLFMIVLISNYNVIFAHAESKEVQLSSVLTESSSSYSSASDNTVTTMKNGKKGLTSISITGDILNESTKDNVKAFGLKGGVASFSISYDDSLLDGSDPDKWHIVSDEKTRVDGYNLEGSVDKGCLLILKKQRGGEYELATNPITNFTYGKDNFYTPSGEDIYEGTYYKIIFAYSSRIRTKEGFIGIGRKYDTYYHMETYEFYLCEDSATISIHDLSVEDEYFENEEYDVNLLKKGATLVDESVTIDGFKLDKLNVTGNTILVTHNGVAVSNVQDGQEFKKPGKYEITVVTRLGRQETQTIYVFSAEDKGYSTFFGENLIHANRVFRFGEYPTYAKGASIKINAVDENTPVLHGTVTNVDTGEVVFTTNNTRQSQQFTLAPANYQVEFFSGNNEIAGSVYQYTFRFEVIDENSAPYVNYYNLMHTERLEDLQSKHYEVVYQTTLGGYIFVCFSLDSYDDAFEYAYEIEKRFIEQKEDGLYYKSLENPSLKVKYFDYIELTSALNFYAAKNVEVNYFNPLDEFTYQTYDNDLLGSLESLNLEDSIKVFPSQEEKEKLIKRKPYINNFQFINVADYDVTKITAFCEKDNKIYNIELNKPIDEQLNVSSKYTIKETNVYGDDVSYDVFFINENQTISHWIATTNGVETVIDVSARDIQNGKMEIVADSLVLKDITNLVDDNAIVTIKAPNVYSYEVKCLISEMDGFTLYEPGEYELTFVDIMGNYYQLIVRINGAQWNDILAENTVSYTTLYNAVHLNHEEANVEEAAYDSTMFSKTMDEVSGLEYMLYTAETIEPLIEKYNQALAVAQNKPTQKEINALNTELEALKSQLTIRNSKQELFDALTSFATLEIGAVPKQKADTYQEVYDKASAVLYNTAATDDEISAAINSIVELQEEILNPSVNWVVFLVIGICVAVIVVMVVLFLYMKKRRDKHETN